MTGTDAAGTTVLDCRWLGIGGPGKTTELALRGLAVAPPPGRWILWGPAEKTAALAWPGAEVRPIEADPRLLLGQRHALQLPHGNFHVFMHQQRPLRAVPAATVIYDTIALRHGGTRPQRALKRAFLRRVARTSTRILTISEHSKATILRDLGADERKVHIIRFPFDDALVERVLAARRQAPVPTTDTAGTALFVGGFLPHKNLPRLLEAFGRTDFCAAGGRLVLVAGTPGQAADFDARLDGGQRQFVTVLHSCSQADLDRLYATSRFLVQPSIEEGFGLPAWEALCCGLPVCASDGGALPEATQGLATTFPATSVPAMVAALDACADGARAWDAERAAAQSAQLRAQAPTVARFGAQFLQAVSGSDGVRVW